MPRSPAPVPPPDTKHDVGGATSGVVRAGVFGISDGLVSNLALIMGMAAGTNDQRAIVLAGVAGLLGGAFSMAAGEYISMRTQREALQRQLTIEREQLIAYPTGERDHLVEMLVDRGLESDQAGIVADNVHRDLSPALEFHAILELGIAPGDLGAPMRASVVSFVMFVVGAAVPLGPWLFIGDGLFWSIGLAAVSLAAVGAAMTRITGQNAVYGAVRQLTIGAAAAAVTYGIGSIVGAVI